MSPETAWWVLETMSVVVLVYFFTLNMTYLLMSLAAVEGVHRYRERMRAEDGEALLRRAGSPPITLVAPAYNEAQTCVAAMKALLSLKYPRFEILMVNDGSKDETVATMTAAFDLEPAARAPMGTIPTRGVRGTYRSRRAPNLWLIDKDNGGKADALNVGLNYCRTPLFCAMDTDTLLDDESMLRLVQPFMRDGRTVATGAVIRIVNDCVVEHGRLEETRIPGSWVARFQVLEYLRAFLGGRTGWDQLNATLIISGAFGVFRRALVVREGGFRTDTVGEDMELVVRLHRRLRERGEPYRILFVPDPVAWTECPEDLGVLGRQRDRWQRGLIEVLTFHRKMLLNPGYGRVGMLAMPFFYFLEMLGPVIEVCGYLAFACCLLAGRVSVLFSVVFTLLAVVWGMCLSIAGVALEEMNMHRYERPSDLVRLFVIAIVENVGYRQVAAWWRFKGVVSSLRGVKSWGAMTRKGFANAAGAGPDEPGSPPDPARDA